MEVEHDAMLERKDMRMIRRVFVSMR
jgi:hypothetical protein